MAAQKAGAPLAKTGGVRLSEAPTVSGGGAGAPASVGLFDPTQRPNEPVTAGIDMGAGVGSNALSMAKSTTKTSDTLAKLLPFDSDGSIAILYQQAIARGD
jgi:hypothetical protein